MSWVTRTSQHQTQFVTSRSTKCRQTGGWASPEPPARARRWHQATAVPPDGPTSERRHAMGRVEGKVAFITGAPRGQGRSHAVRLAQEGADIIAIDLCGPIANLPYPHATPEDLAQTVKEVEALDRRIVARQADVRDRDAMKQAIDTGVAELGHLDIV